jgi:hypothetical protein
MSWNTVLMIAVTFAVAWSVGDFVRHPGKYGEIMRKFDEARYNIDPNFYVGPVD